MAPFDVSRSTWLSARLTLLAIAGVCLALGAYAAPVHAQEASSAVYIRTDSDQTTVISPRLHVGAPVGEATRLDVVYSVDVWTSASVDIRASASKTITEQRDQIDASFGQDVGEWKLAAGYRFSTEPDYVSHGGSLGAAYDFADHAATLALGASASFDDVGRAGDPGFARSVHTLGARVAFTQVLDAHMVGQVLYELSDASGYLSSPYRFIGIGGADARCRSDGTQYCIPEANPDERVRHAFALRLRRALNPSLSLGGSYRFYLDDWKLTSHTMQLELTWLPAEDTSLGLRYRFYTQGAAAQYSARYAKLDQGDKFFTSDKELSPFSAHKVAVDVEREWQLDDAHNTLLALLSIGPSFYFYSDFPPLEQITALEVSIALVLKR